MNALSLVCLVACAQFAASQLYYYYPTSYYTPMYYYYPTVAAVNDATQQQNGQDPNAQYTQQQQYTQTNQQVGNQPQYQPTTQYQQQNQQYQQQPQYQQQQQPQYQQQTQQYQQTPQRDSTVTSNTQTVATAPMALAAQGTLYTYPENFRAYKALIAAQFSGAKVKVAEDFVFGETNKTEAFLKKFPTGKVPAFETNDGKVLSESNAIAYFLSNAQLRGGNCVYQQAQIQQWISFAENEVVPASCAWVFPLLGIMPFNKNAVEQAKKDVTRVLEVLNKHFLGNTFLVGERITLADVVVFSNLLHLYQYVLEPSVRAPFGNLNRWFNTILNQPQVLAVLKNFQICAKQLQFDPKKYAEFQAKSGAAPAQKQEKKKEEKKPAAKKEKEPAEEMDAAELALAAEPKSKDPFDALPKGTFNFDDFKRVYSNEEEAKSIPYFFEKFDPENYSIWYGEYKYNEELTKTFMSCNLITGMFQRIDKMRKAAFASVCLFGTDNDSTISGIWVWRGQNLAFELSPDWQVDYEVYDWKKLDAKSEETKKLVTQYFSWVGEDKQGRKFNQGKIFK